jgi:hypothetical protein
LTYRNHDDALLVSDDNVTRHDGHLPAGYGHLDFYDHSNNTQ